uniref:Uncharacterized protein n=1 Tax=Anguilla anguilla TaxID=7936 RepID=A0A0E9R7I2_ANGAN
MLQPYYKMDYINLYSQSTHNTPQ